MRAPLRKRLRASKNAVYWRLVVILCTIIRRTSSRAIWDARLAHGHVKLGQDHKAVPLYERALAMPEPSTQWFQSLAAIHKRTQNLEDGIRALRKGIDLYPQAAQLRHDLANLHERAGDFDQALQCLTAATDLEESSSSYAALAELHARAKDWPGCVRAYKQAADLEPTNLTIQLSLAAAAEQVPDLAASASAYRTALDLSGFSPEPRLRLKLARVLDAAGRWREAMEVLEANISEYSTHAPSHRLLAAVAHSAWRWNGSLSGASENPSSTTFSRFDDATLEAWGLQHPDQVLIRACQAMEHATRLRPHHVKWLLEAARLRALTGYHGGAIAAYEHAVYKADASNSPAELNVKHEAQFGLESTRALTEMRQVEDPLFDITIRPSGEPIDDYLRPVGFFDAISRFSGIEIHGFVIDPDTERVEVWVDDALLRPQVVSERACLPRFRLLLTRETLALFPEKSCLTVRHPDGGELLGRGRAPSLQLHIPHGTNRIGTILEAGQKLDKKGVILPSSAETDEKHDAYLRLYEEVRTVFHETFGKPLLLFYGNLLGLYRDGGFIPGDDDFDVGYVSDYDNPEDVKEETCRVMEALVRAGFTVSISRRGAPFRVQKELTPAAAHLSVRQAWFHEGKAWILRFANFPAKQSDFLPPREAHLNGRKVLIPQNPEVFLRGHYGPTWHIPDPGFIYYGAELGSELKKYLGLAYFTPEEFREFQQRIEESLSDVPDAGRAVSLGAQSLYPLHEYII